jgi:CHASE2 domain-containing sensor protein
MKFWTFLASILSDVNGQPSTNRLLAFFTTLIPLLTWSYNIFDTSKWVEPSPELIALIGVGLGAKVIQRNIEQKKSCEGSTND